MNTRRGRSRVYLLACAAVALGATSQAGCTLEQVATSATGMETAGKAFSSFLDFAHFTVDPQKDSAEDFDVDSPAE